MKYKNILFKTQAFLLPLIIWANLANAQIKISDGTTVDIPAGIYMISDTDFTIDNGGGDLDLRGFATVNGNFTNSAGSSALSIESDASGTGSLIVSGTTSGSITAHRFVNANFWHYVSAPVMGQALNGDWMSGNSIVNTPPNQFFRWDEAINYWIIFGDDLFLDTEFGTAKGYAATRSADGDFSFAGTVNTSTVNYTATFNAVNGNGFNLIGNPFSSTIAINETAQESDNFLADNAGILDANYQAIYIWQEGEDYTYGNNDYSVICNTLFSGEGSESILTDNFIQPGQAFMVKVKQAGDIVFNTDIRKHSSAGFYKNNDSWPGVELRIANSEHSNTTIIAFNQNMTTGLDPSYDAAKFKGNPKLALYTKLVDDNGKDFAIQALPDHSIEDYIVPIGVDVAESGVFEFSAKQDKLDNYSLLLEDRQENSFTDLRWDTYFATISQSRTGRFYLHFKDATAIGENPNQENEILIWAANGNIYISAAEHAPLHSSSTGVNGTALHAALTVTDITGRIVLHQQLSDDNFITIPVNLETGIYLVMVRNGEEVRTEKVFIK